MKQILFKNLKAFELENDSLRVVVIPELGGKTVSIFHKEKGFELLFQNKKDVYRIPKSDSNFAEYDASGFDDAFPNIDSEKFVYAGKTIKYPDHGEIWTTPMEVEISTANGLSMICDGTVLPYNYKKQIYIDGNDICYKYNITNIGKYSYPCFWTLHCLVNCEDDIKIVLPSEVKKIINVQKSKNLGEIGCFHSYPISQNGFELDRVRPKSEGTSEKYYAVGKILEGECGIIYPSKSLMYILKFDANDLPYLGFWVTSGGFRGDYNCAIEPSNGYYDSISIAEKNHALPILKPGEGMKFEIRISLENLD